jgi:hypothetical protein
MAAQLAASQEGLSSVSKYILLYREIISMILLLCPSVRQRRHIEAIGINYTHSGHLKSHLHRTQLILSHT